MKRRIIVIAAVCVALAVLAAAAAGVFLLRCGGIVVKPSIEHPAGEAIVAYRQDDARWAEDALGTSKYTMGSSGCVVTCIASALSGTDMDCTPGELNRLLSEGTS